MQEIPEGSLEDNGLEPSEQMPDDSSTLNSFEEFFNSPDVDPTVKAWFEKAMQSSGDKWAEQNFPGLKDSSPEEEQKFLESIYKFFCSVLKYEIGEGPSVENCRDLLERFKESPETQLFREEEPNFLGAVDFYLITIRVNESSRREVERQRQRHKRLDLLRPRASKIKAALDEKKYPYYQESKQELAKLLDDLKSVENNLQFIEEPMPERTGTGIRLSWEAGRRKQNTANTVEWMLEEMEKIATSLEGKLNIK